MGGLLSFVAGMLTALSPCVLPILPFVVGSGTARSRFAPVAIMAGMIVSFVVVGLFVSTVGFALGLDQSAIRTMSAIVMILAGVVLIVPALNQRVSALFAPLAAKAGSQQGARKEGLAGNLATGALLGAVWSPCVGPTLGAALGLAAQGGSIVSAASTMFLFGLGASVPLLFAAYASRGLFQKWRGGLMKGGETGKRILAILLVVIGVMILTNGDKALETALLSILPDSWVSLITKY